MKNIIAMLLIIYCWPLIAGEKQFVNPKLLTNQLLVKLLTISESEKIYGQAIDNSNFSAKLYRVGKTGSCVAETHVICSYDYYLALIEFGDPGETAVYYLGELGKIDSVEAHRDETSDRALFTLRVSDYPEYVKNRHTKVVNLYVSLGFMGKSYGFELKVK